MKNQEFRRNRRQRRRNRYERESRTLWMYATITIMSLASLLVSLAKAVFQFSVDLIGPLNFFLMSCGMIAFGLVMLLGLYQKGNRWTTGALAIGALVVVFGGLRLGDNEAASVRWVYPDNPWDFELPNVRQSSMGGEPHLMLVIGENNAAFSPYTAIPPEDEITNERGSVWFISEHPADFGQFVRQEADYWLTVFLELQSHGVLGVEPELRVRVNADRCTEFGHFYSFQRTLVESGIHTELGVQTPFDSGYLRLHFSRLTEEHGAPVVTLMPNHVEVLIPSEPAASLVHRRCRFLRSLHWDLRRLSKRPRLLRCGTCVFRLRRCRHMCNHRRMHQ